MKACYSILCEWYTVRSKVVAEHNQSKRYGLVVIMEGRSFSPDGEQMREARQNLLNEVVLARKEVF